jgi:nucleoside 2-deoxyribosyltransferase
MNTRGTGQGTRESRHRWQAAEIRNGKRRYVMAGKKVVFVAFAIEDERQRDFLKGQSLNTRSPFEYVDMSVKEPYNSEWKERVRTRIRRSDGVVALVSKNSVPSSGQKWEIACAKEENKPVLGIWAYTDDRTNLTGVRTVTWTWPAIANFIDSL